MALHPAFQISKGSNAVLPEIIEGLVHVSHMTDDHYNFNERAMAMIGERTGTMYRIGDKVEIEVVGVNLDERLIDFKVVGMPERKPRERRRGPVEIKGNKKEKTPIYINKQKM